MDTIKFTSKQIWARTMFLVITGTVLLGSISWSFITWINLITSIQNNIETITLHLSTFYCASMIIISGCAVFIIAYELINKKAMPKAKMQATIYVLMLGIAIMVFLPKHAGKYYIDKVEQQGYTFDQGASFQLLFYRKLVFKKY